jgi:hypothetical protein
MLVVSLAIYQNMCFAHMQEAKRDIKRMGPLRESNPGPPAPKAGIMPLDQADCMRWEEKYNYSPKLDTPVCVFLFVVDFNFNHSTMVR